MVRQLSVLVVSALAVSLVSCASNTPATDAVSSQAQAVTSRKTLQVVTTFIPMTDFTKAVAGNRADVTQLLPTNVGRANAS